MPSPIYLETFITQIVSLMPPADLNTQVDSMVPKTAAPKNTEAAAKPTEPAASDATASPAPAAGSVGPSAAAVAAATNQSSGPEGLPPLANVTGATTADNLPKQASVNGTGGYSCEETSCTPVQHC